MTVVDQERIRGLLAEGWHLLQQGEPREAVLVFGRVLLVDSRHAEARRGLDAARAAVTESERRLDERLEEARRAAARGDAPAARRLLEEVVASGGDRDRAHVLLDRIDAREGRLEPPQASGDGAILDPGPLRSERRAWSRPAFADACLNVYAVMAGGIASTWDGLMARLAEPPAPRTAPAGPTSAPTGPAVPALTPGERALAEARRRMEAGDAAGALTILDAISPQEPAYPLARRLRSEAQRVLPVRPVPGSGTPR